MFREHVCEDCGCKYTTTNPLLVFCNHCAEKRASKSNLARHLDDVLLRRRTKLIPTGLRDDVKLLAREIFIKAATDVLHRMDEREIEHIATVSVNAAQIYFKVEDNV